MKTIIAYTSKYGCTEKAAFLLKSQLEGDGEIEVVNLTKAKDLSLANYDAVILGGSIYFGKIQKEMSEFTNKNHAELKNKRVGLFICAGMKGEQATKELSEAFPEDLYTGAVAKEVFGDEVYEQKLTLMDKFILRMLRGKERGGSGLSKETIERFALAMSN